MKNFYIVLQTPQGKFYIKVDAMVQRDASFYATHHYPHFEILATMSAGQWWQYSKRHTHIKEMPKELV